MSERIEQERGGSGRRWGRRVGQGAVLALLMAAVSPGGCERVLHGERKLDRAER
jgi:hypothetical protein